MDTLSTIALTWRIERRDGITIGLTSHDRDLTIDGFAYRAAPGMTPSAIRRSADLDADTMDVTGALGGAAIAEGDLIAGRWDGARVVVRAINWDSGAVIAELGEGRIGQVELRDGSFTAELAGIGALLDRPVCEATSPECRAELGDTRCRVAMAGRRRFARVMAINDTLLTIDAAEPVANAYGNGLLRWIGGGNSGLESAIAASGGATLTLRVPPRFESVGARAGRADRGLRQEHRDVRRALRQCRQFSRRALFAGDRPADAVSRRVKIPQYAQVKRHPGFMPGSAVPDAPHLDAPTTSLAEMRTPAQGRGDGEGYASAETSSSARALTRAREGLGVPFRLHGRDLRGMDCVGLVAWAWEVGAPTGYALRASPVARIDRVLAALGFVVGMAPGAIVLVAPGAGQLHLGISTGSGIIHADAVARRVVERAAPLPWPILAGWIREA